MNKSKKQIWDALIAVDVSKYVEFLFWDGKTLPYIPWHSMHFLMMEHFPEYSWSFSEDEAKREAHYYEGGTCEVRCTMTIGEHTIITSLPVKDDGAAPLNPASDRIANAKQRCRVKAAAEFGLGFALWHEPERFTPDAPEAPAKEKPKKKQSDAQIVQEYFEDKVSSQKTRAAAADGMKKLVGGLKNRKKPLDGAEKLWSELCAEREWAK